MPRAKTLKVRIAVLFTVRFSSYEMADDRGPRALRGHPRLRPSARTCSVPWVALVRASSSTHEAQFGQDEPALWPICRESRAAKGRVPGPAARHHPPAPPGRDKGPADPAHLAAPFS